MVIERSDGRTTTRLDPTSLVDLWETHAQRGALHAGITALERAGNRDVLSLTLGDRNERLLTLRQAHLGDDLNLVATCPHCGVDVEATVSCDQLIAAGSEDDATDRDGAKAERGSWDLTLDGYRIRMRPLRVAAEVGAVAADDLESARAVLITAAVTEAFREADVVEPTQLPEAVVVAAGDSVLQADRLAEVELQIMCPECSRSWPASLDVSRLVPEELSRLGAELLGDVDLLARTYGWTEAAVLALPAARRATYVALASG